MAMTQTYTKTDGGAVIATLYDISSKKTTRVLEKTKVNEVATAIQRT
jgi:hypothetical protein